MKGARKIRFAALVAALLLSGAARGESTPPVLAVRIVPDSIGIGDRFELEVTVDKDVMQIVDFPAFDPMGTGSPVEISAVGPVDTLAADGRRQRLRKRYTMGAYASGRFNMGRYPLLWIDKNIVDTIYSPDSMIVRVQGFAIDTTRQQIFDIKPPKPMPVQFREYGLYLVLALVGAALIFLAVRRIVRSRRADRPLFGRGHPADPPHVVAIRKLEQLHNQKVWQNNRHKQYYTALTDIVREYLAGRYDVRAQEMTTDEIVEALDRMHLETRHRRGLDGLLREADLVKFAKWIPSPEENESAYETAYYFVEETKPVDADGRPIEPPAGPDEAPEVPAVPEKGERS